jgi:hypothetical protein
MYSDEETINLLKQTKQNIRECYGFQITVLIYFS